MPISIDLDNTQFFIAIAKKKAHSFIMLGTYGQNKVQHLLCRVGKVFDLKRNADDTIPVSSLFNALGDAAFSSAAAKIQDEGLSRKKQGHQSISYQAYDINFQQYLDFIRILESTQTRLNSFECYKPIGRQYNTIMLERTRHKIFKPRPLAGGLFAATNTISINNNCRHGAIKLVEETLHTSISPLVSTNFFSELPYHTFLEFGVPSQNLAFYVLPPPPNAYTSLNSEKKNAMEKLYKRMEQMVLLEPNSETTQEKFACLKDFYKQLVAEQQEPSLDKLLASIHSWKKEHYSLLSHLRKTYFWDDFITRKSATLTTIEEIERDLANEENGSSCFSFD